MDVIMKNQVAQLVVKTKKRPIRKAGQRMKNSHLFQSLRFLSSTRAKAVITGSMKALRNKMKSGHRKRSVCQKSRQSQTAKFHKDMQQRQTNIFQPKYHRPQSGNQTKAVRQIATTKKTKMAIQDNGQQR